MTTAALEFENADGPADQTTAKPMRFLAVDYKTDFEVVRRIDDSFDPRFGKTSKVGLTP